MELSLLIAVLTVAVPMPGPAEHERFKAYFNRAEALFEQGEFGAAIWNFRQADAMRMTPEVAFDLAKCHEKIRDEAMAVYYYRLYLRRSPQASDALEVAEKIGAALAHHEADGRGLLEVEAFGAKELFVDRRHFPEAPLSIFLPPGDYELSATFPSGTRKLPVQIRTGKVTHQTFEPLPAPLLGSRSEMAASYFRPPAETALTASASRPTSKLRVASYIALGIGAAALVTGTVLGTMAAGDASRSSDYTLTVREAEQFATASNGKATGANVLWGVGAAGVASGAAMFVFSMPEPGMKHEVSK